MGTVSDTVMQQGMDIITGIITMEVVIMAGMVIRIRGKSISMKNKGTI